MRFAYLGLPARQPIYSLGGVSIRHRPIVPTHLMSQRQGLPIDSAIDSAADDTIFSEAFARRLGVDLGGAPIGQGQAASGVHFAIRYARVRLLLTDGYESCEWDSLVGFAPYGSDGPSWGMQGSYNSSTFGSEGLNRKYSSLPIHHFMEFMCFTDLDRHEVGTVRTRAKIT